MQKNHTAAAAQLGIAATALAFLGTGVLLGVDLPELLTRVAYGIGMCVTARLAARMLHPLLARRGAEPGTQERSHEGEPRMEFTIDELKILANALATMEDDYGDLDGADLRQRIVAEMDGRVDPGETA